MAGVTFVHTSGRAVTVGAKTRVARLLGKDDAWSEQGKSESKGDGRGAGNGGRRRSTARTGGDGGGDDAS